MHINAVARSFLGAFICNNYKLQRALFNCVAYAQPNSTQKTRIRWFSVESLPMCRLPNAFLVVRAYGKAVFVEPFSFVFISRAQTYS